MTVRRRIMVVAATVLMFALILGVARMASRPGMALLYSGLENGAAGEVVQALEARGIAYDIRGASIYVDSAARDELRLTLASEGLPSNPTQGYEILDRLTGFGTTSQMFDAAYWRAKEGELARTIMAGSAVQNARVHIANPGSKPFQRDSRTTASVTVTPSGGGLGAAHARALRYLVASAVTGLSPDDVSIIDSSGRIILGGEDDNQSRGGEDRSADLQRDVERLLEARVGAGKAVVQVNVETITDREQITERTVDPASRVAISEDTIETSTSATDVGGTGVTVASNLPDGDAAGGEDRSQSDNTETRARVNYEISEVQREILRTPGGISRISTAVLIDGIRTVADDGTVTWEPRPDLEMEALRELVASAVGYDAERGDSLTLKTMEFEPVGGDGSGAASGLAFPAALDAMRLAQMAIMGLVALAIGIFVVRPILSKRADAPAAIGPPDASNTDAALTGEIDTGQPPGTALQIVSNAQDGSVDGRDPVARLRQLIDERQEESLEVLKSWMEDDGEKA